MKTLLIIYHSQTGGTAAMARAAAEGAAEAEEVVVRLCLADEVSAADAIAADGFIFASPEYLGGMAGRLKDFFDRSYYDALDRLNGRPYALLVCAGSDGQGVVRQLERIATGWRLRAVGQALIVCTPAQTREAIQAPKHVDPEDLQRCRDTGAALAAGLALGIY